MKLAVGIAVVLICLMLFVVWQTFPPNNKADTLSIATYVVLTLTLIAVIVYAADTKAIARISREQWNRQGVFDIVYEMRLADRNESASLQRILQSC